MHRKIKTIIGRVLRRHLARDLGPGYGPFQISTADAVNAGDAVTPSDRQALNFVVSSTPSASGAADSGSALRVRLELIADGAIWVIDVPADRELWVARRR